MARCSISYQFCESTQTWFNGRLRPCPLPHWRPMKTRNWHATWRTEDAANATDVARVLKRASIPSMRKLLVPSWLDNSIQNLESPFIVRIWFLTIYIIYSVATYQTRCGLVRRAQILFQRVSQRTSSFMNTNVFVLRKVRPIQPDDVPWNNCTMFLFHAQSLIGLLLFFLWSQLYCRTVWPSVAALVTMCMEHHGP
jgi:hypothetical protein